MSPGRECARAESPLSVSPAEETAALDCWISAWIEGGDPLRRRELEWRIAALQRDALLLVVRSELRWIGRSGSAGLPAAEDAVAQALIELPATLAAFVEEAARGGAAGFRSFLLRSTLNVARRMVDRVRREQERVRRLPELRPSALGRPPTTPSRSLFRSELFELLARETSALGDLDQTILRRRLAGAGYAEIGRELDVPRRTVQDRCERCMERLKRVIERAFGGDPRGA